MLTTLNRIQHHSPDPHLWGSLLLRLGKNQADDEPISIVQILDLTELFVALWCMGSVPGHESRAREFAIFCANQIRDQMTDPRSLYLLETVSQHHAGAVTFEVVMSALVGASQVPRKTQGCAQAAALAATATAMVSAWMAALATWSCVGTVVLTSIATDSKGISRLKDIRSDQAIRFRELFAS